MLRKQATSVWRDALMELVPVFRDAERRPMHSNAERRNEISKVFLTSDDFLITLANLLLVVLNSYLVKTSIVGQVEDKPGWL